MSFVTQDDINGLGFGPVYSRPGKDGRIVGTGNTIPEDVAGRSASRLAGLGILTEDEDPIGINPWPDNSVFRDNLRGMGEIERFARAPKWGAAKVDLDNRPMALSGLGEVSIVDKAKRILKNYGVYIGVGAGAALVLGVVLRMLKKKR